jgi:hypothetical protein
MNATQPKVLFVYFTCTKQTLKVVEASSQESGRAAHPGGQPPVKTCRVNT